ncbi:bacterial Ig-like domain-containing protein [Sinanaerobacter sp. ZZT-01]|uniref:bacterial Ig-like domain-containing protein n=1 Tax=Sinanaerobacter sp. ZZT-01 TaxID=3111540 RepID=UPI002D7A35E7|nr:bacterial Ig-like domain-containing protein [Sinanaerobacter sp. ZZT-01]WRR94183.1 bacterial Ig-like domain-containing protein [Sinanaerobacter sp. ZZT-01]
MENKKYGIRVVLLAVLVAVGAQAMTVLDFDRSTAYGYSVDKVLSKAVTDSKTSSNNSFDQKMEYTDADGYKGSLDKNGASFLKSGSYNPGSPGHVHTSSCETYNYVCWKCGYTTTYGHGHGAGYCVNCKKDSCLNQGKVFKCGMYEGQGYIPASDTRVWQQNYSGTATKTVTEYPKLTNLTILKQPNKISYKEYEDFNPEGMVVQAIYADGHQEEVTGYTLSKKTNLDPSVTSIRVTFSENGGTAYADVPITVAKLTEIEITKLPDKLEYLEELVNIDLEGGELTLKYEDGTISVIPLTDATVGSHGTAIGDINIEVTYKGFTTTYQAKVKAKSPVRIEIIAPPKKTEYIEELPFESEGMTVKAYYDNLTEAMVDNFIITDGDSLTLGQSFVTVSYTENEATVICQQPVTVRKKQLVSIEVKSLPKKTIYVSNRDHLDISGGNLLLHYDNGTEKEMPMELTMMSGFDNTILGEQTITVAYEDKSTTFMVIVAKVNRIRVSKLPNTTDYLEGLVNIDLTGGELTLDMEGGYMTSIPLTEATIDHYGSLVGSQEVTVSYGGLSTTFPIKVLAKSPVSLEIVKPPNKMDYIEEQSFQFEGIEVKITYNNHTTDIAKELSSSDGTNLKFGQESVTISYTENGEVVTCQQPVTVRKKQAIGIEILPESKNSYTMGELINSGDIKVNVIYDNGTKSPVPSEELTIKGYKPDEAGNQTITVHYKEFASTFDITVNRNSRSSGKEENKDGPYIKAKEPDDAKDAIISAGNGTIKVTVSELHPEMYLVVPVPEGKVARNLLDNTIPSFQTMIDGKLYVKISKDAEFEFIDNDKDFVDINRHWAKKEIQKASAREIFAGVGKRKFAPNENMTKGMLAAVLHRLDDNKPVTSDYKKQKWYDKSVAWAIENDIAEEKSIGTFHPESDVTREELAVMLYKFAKYSGADVTTSKDALHWMTDNDILIGRPDGALDPDGFATRSEVATMLNKSIVTMLIDQGEGK